MTEKLKRSHEGLNAGIDMQMEAVEDWLKSRGPPENVMDIIQDMRRAKNAASKPASGYPLQLGEMLLWSWPLQEGDSRDKIHALLDMVRGPHGIVPDYRKSKEETHIYCALLAGKNSSPSLMCRITGPRDFRLTLPSWVPDYTTRQTYVMRVMMAVWSGFLADDKFPALP